ncbi:uncharacterized protein METZ01_LOCUS475012, partial [marine metagenome]
MNREEDTNSAKPDWFAPIDVLYKERTRATFRKPGLSEGDYTNSL